MFLQFEVCLQSALHSHLVVLQPSPHTICPYHFRAPRSSFRANRFIKPSACGCSAYHWGSDGDSWNWQPNWVCTLTFKLTFRSIGFRRLWSCWKLPFWCPIFNFRGVPYGSSRVLCSILTQFAEPCWQSQFQAYRTYPPNYLWQSLEPRETNNIWKVKCVPNNVFSQP